MCELLVLVKCFEKDYLSFARIESKFRIDNIHDNNNNLESLFQVVKCRVLRPLVASGS